MFKRFLIALLIGSFAVSCGTSPKTAKQPKVSPYAYKSSPTTGEDTANQSSIEDLIYGELSKRQQALLKKYRVPSSTHALGGIKFDIPMTMNSAVQNWINYFTNGSGRKHFSRYLARSTRFVPTQLAILKENGLPKDLIFLSMIESGYNTHAYSSAAASGLWQFIKSTGRLYGLNSDYWVDERRNPEKATLAAARHLRDLHQEFGDWYLAFAAYNAGAGKVRRAIQATGSKDFWVLAASSYLRQETKDYVPKILAAAIVGKSPEKYGFTDIDFQDPIATEKVSLPSATDLEVVAECAGVDTDLIRLINPELVRNMTPPSRTDYTLYLPRGTKKSFENRYARLSPAERLQNVRYAARGGESIKSIAASRGVSVASLVGANPALEGKSRVPSSMTLMIPKTYDSAPAAVASTYPVASKSTNLVDLISDKSADSEKTKKKPSKKEVVATHETPANQEKTNVPVANTEGEMKVVWRDQENTDPTSQVPPKATESAPAVSDLSSSTSSEELAQANDVEERIQQALSQVGQNTPSPEVASVEGAIRVKPSGEDSETPKSKEVAKQPTPKNWVTSYHKVKRGETLTQIAEKYRVSVADLKEWNRLSEKRGLLADQKLTIRTEAAIAKTKPVLKPKIIAYKVRRGDTINKIAKKYEVDPSDILSLNKLSKRTALRPGLVLKIPAKTSSSKA